MVSPLCALEVQNQNHRAFQTAACFSVKKNLNGKRENPTPKADLPQSHRQICAGLHRRAEGQRRALIVALRQKLLPPRVLRGPLQRKERSPPPQPLCFAQNRLKPRESCALSCNLSFVGVGGHAGRLAGSSARYVLVCRLLQKNDIFEPK